MSETTTDLARQLLAIEQLLGADLFLPALQNPLPEITLPEPSASPVMEDVPALSDAEKPAALAALKTDEVDGCTRCVLHETRTNIVFGEGSPTAKLVFVGEGPGADEDASGRPFVGRSGDLLTKMIHAMGLTREQVFIVNMVKCRPPANRTPSTDEVNACWGYLMKQLQIIRPEVIVTLGNPATKGMLQTKTGITQLRGQWQRLPALASGLEGIAVMPTFHPAFVLRRYTPEIRGKAWSDLQQVMTKLGLSLPKP